MLPIIAAIAGAGYLVKKGVDLLDASLAEDVERAAQDPHYRTRILSEPFLGYDRSDFNHVNKSYVETVVNTWEEPGPFDVTGRAAGKHGMYRHYFKAGRKPDGTTLWKRRVFRR